MQLAIVIMAAGKGTRLKSRRPKVLHQVGGKPLVEHVIGAAAQAVEPKDIYVVIGHEAEAVRAALAHTGVRFVVQAEQRGTGHAILTARPEVEGYETLIVLSGDAPMITTETILRLRDFHLEQQAAMTILTARPPNPTGYGRVIRKTADKPEVLAILEQKALKPEQLSAPEINSGIYAFRAEPLFKHIGQLSTDNAHGEYYLTDMAALLGKASERVVALETADVHEVLGANTIAEMMELDAEMRMRAARALMAEGVTIFRPETSVIDGTVKVGADTIVEPFVQLLGRTVIGSGCRIRSYSVIEDSTIGDDVLVRNGSIITSAVDCEQRADWAVFASASRVGDRRGRARGKFRGDEEGAAGGGGEGESPELPGRCGRWPGHEHWRRRDHVQLRRQDQEPDQDRRECFRRQRCDAGGAACDRRWELHRGGFDDHRGRAGGCTGAGTCTPDHEARLGQKDAFTPGSGVGSPIRLSE